MIRKCLSVYAGVRCDFVEGHSGFHRHQELGEIWSDPSIRLLIKRLNKMACLPDLPLPTYATAGAAGIDLRSASDVAVAVGMRVKLSTGMAAAIPYGYEGHVRIRSGVAERLGLQVLSGTVDSDYRGEIFIPIINLGDVMAKVARGDRVAQLVVSPVARCVIVEVQELDETDRGTGGFGSTGDR